LAQGLIARIAHLSREWGLPVLWVEQRIGDILPLADRALLLSERTVSAETQSPKEWLAADILSELTISKTCRTERRPGVSGGIAGYRDARRQSHE